VIELPAVVLEGGLNLYGYVGNDPGSQSDPSGLVAGVDDAIAAAAAAAALTGATAGMLCLLNPACRDPIEHGVDAAKDTFDNIWDNVCRMGRRITPKEKKRRCQEGLKDCLEYGPMEDRRCYDCWLKCDSGTTGEWPIDDGAGNSCR
jgi:hypothetical protein